jgi:hypothetical protein
MSASGGAGGGRIRRLFARAADAGSLGAVIFRGIGAILFAIGTAIASGVLTVADVFIIPLNALAGAAGDLVTSLFGGAASIINLGAIATALSIGPGGRFNLGPFTFLLGIGAVLLGFFALGQFLAEDETGNFVPGIPFDVPTPFFGGPEEEDDD